jgi:hypothetical protein
VAPLRTINDAFFEYFDTDGIRRTVRRGETADIPEGADLTRGDKWGAFTKEVGEEPLPPEGSYVIRPQLDWSSTEFDRYTDAVHISEVQDHLEATAELDRAPLALLILESENRKQNPRPKLVEYLAALTGTADQRTTIDEAPTGVVPGTAGEDTLIDHGVKVEEPIEDAEPVTPQEGEPVAADAARTPVVDEDIVEFVSTNTIDVVLARAGDDAATAAALREAELSRGDKARKTLITDLEKIETPPEV